MVMDTDVIVVGAGPTGLMLAGELCRAGVRPLVLERHPAFRDIPKAGGLNGRIVELVRYRGLLERFEGAGTAPIPAPQLPFGGIHVDFTGLADPPMELLMLPQPQLERLLAEIAGEFGAEIRRGQELVGLSQDDGSVTAEVRGPEGTHEITARYLVGCDGASSRVREIADISFPGTTFPEIQRMAQTTIPESVTVLENRDLEVVGVGRIPFGFTPTERGVFAMGSVDRSLLGVYTSEQESVDYDDDEPMTVTEVRDSIRRVLGVDLPLGEPVRLTRFSYHARHAERYRDGRFCWQATPLTCSLPGRGARRRHDRRRQPWLEACGRDRGPGAARPARHLPRRTPPRRRARPAPRPGPVGDARDTTRPPTRSASSSWSSSDEQAQRRIGAFIAGTDVRYPGPTPTTTP